MQKENVENEKNVKFEIRSGADLINQYKKLPEPKLLWNGIIEGAFGLITGVGKTGKTTFAENLAMSLAVGKNEFYGYELDANPRKVLFINLEEKLWRIGRRNSTQIESLNEKEKALFSSNYFVAPEEFPEYLMNDSDWENLEEYIKKINPDVLFIDSLTHMCMGEIEKSSVAQEFTRKLKKYIAYLNITTFIIHHNTKGNDKPMTQDSIAGSRIITQEFDFALGLGNVPTAKGGTYSCILYNKDSGKENNKAITYSFDENYNVLRLGESNVYDLYAETKTDGRKNDKNKNIVVDYILGKHSQGSQSITSNELKSEFVENNTFSKQTLYSVIKCLKEDGSIIMDNETKGNYFINID